MRIFLVLFVANKELLHRNHGLNFVTLYKNIMIEKQSINGKDVWLKINPYHVERANSNIIPTEYFTATYYLEEPTLDTMNGEIIKDEDGEPKLFESPVAALTFARKTLEGTGANS